jgi:hypothetical protein
VTASASSPWTIPNRVSSKQILFLLYFEYYSKKSAPHYRPEVPGGFQEVKVPSLRDNGPGWW